MGAVNVNCTPQGRLPFMVEVDSGKDGERLRYIILCGTSRPALQQAVNTLMDEGYEPAGGVATDAWRHADGDATVYLLQAMLLNPIAGVV